MTGAPLSLRALLAWSTVAMGLDIGVARITYGTILPALSRDLGLDYVTGGLLSSVNLAAYLAGTLAAPRLGGRFGMRRLASLGHLGFAAGALLCGAATEIGVLAIGRILMGFGAGVGLLALFVVVFGATAPSRRSAVSALVWSGIGFAIVLGGAAAPWLLLPGGWWRLSLLVPALAAVGVGLAFRREVVPAEAAVPAAPAPAADGRSGSSLLRHLPLAGAYLMFGVGYITYSTFAGSRLAASGAPTSAVVLAWIALGTASVAGSALTAAILSASSLRRAALVLALGAGAIGCALVAIGGPVLDVAGPLFVGLGMASTPALVTAYARARSDDASYPRVFAFATVGLGIGQLLGPSVAGLLAAGFGSDATMLFATAAYGAGAALAVLDAARDTTASSN